MALIGKIREKSVLLVIVIFVALMAFVLGDWQSFSRGGESKYGYGTVYGDKVAPEKYEEMLNTFVQNDKNAAAQQGKEWTQKDEAQSADKAWTFVVETTILEKEMEALGIEVGQAEFDAYLYGRDGFTVLPDLAQNFSDSLGRFNEKALQQRIQQMESSDKPEERKAWEDSKEYYTDRRKQEKYFSIINQGVYVTKAEAEEEYLAQKTVKSIDLVLKRYSDIPDEEIKVTDEQLEAYYSEHKHEKKYYQKFGSRELKLFDVKIEPSKEDIKNFNEKMETLKTEFAATKNDSVFIVKNSDFKFYSKKHMATFLPEGDEKARQGLTYPAAMDSVFKSATVGTIVGPYQDGENIRIAKVLDFNTNRLKVRHILLSATKSDSAKVKVVEKKADSLLALINKDNFEEYVTRFSEDPGSKDKGGVYENFLDYEMVPEFSKFATDKPVGSIGVVQTDYGFHIMEVLEKTPVKFPVLAVVQKTLKPSAETIAEKEQEVYDMLYKLDSKLSKIEDPVKKVEMFDSVVLKEGYYSRPTTIAENKPVVYGFNTEAAENKLIQLAFQEDVQVGTLSSSPIKDKDRYIIAIVAKVKEKGIPTLEDIKETVKYEVIKAAKAKRFINKMKGAQSLDQLAKKLNSPVQSAEVTFASPQINQVGFEPEIIGALFSGLKDGQKTIPLEGRNGVYVVKIKKTTNAPATSNYSAERDQLLAQARQSAAGAAKQALIEKAEVVDNRKFLAIGLRR